MNADRINSTGQVVLKSEAFENNRAQGNTTTFVWTGSRAQMVAKRFQQLALNPSVVKLESTGDGNYQLMAQFGYDQISGGDTEKPVNAHELENDIESVDVWNSDVLRAQLYASFGSWAGVNGALTFLKGKVDVWEDSKTHDSAAITSFEAAFDIYSGAQKTLMLNLFRGVAYHQIKQAPQFKSVYRRRITAANYNQVQAAFTGSGKIWTTGEVISFEGVPSLWWFNLPSDVVWFKARPTVNTIAGQRTEICYNYVAAKYAWSGIHEAYNSATLISF